MDSLVLPQTALLKLQREVSRCRATVPESSFLKLGTYWTNYLNQTGKYFHILFLIHRLTQCKKFFTNDSLTLEECDQHNFLLLLKSKSFVSWRV
jgi:hypothetical protein